MLPLEGDQRHLEVLAGEVGHPLEAEEEDRQVLVVLEGRPSLEEEVAILGLEELAVNQEVQDQLGEEVVACLKEVVEGLVHLFREELAVPLVLEALVDLAVEEEQLMKEEAEAASKIQREAVVVALELQMATEALLYSWVPKVEQLEALKAYQVVALEAHSPKTMACRRDHHLIFAVLQTYPSCLTCQIYATVAGLATLGFQLSFWQQAVTNLESTEPDLGFGFSP